MTTEKKSLSPVQVKISVNQKIIIAIGVLIAVVLLYLLKPILTPFLVAAFLAYIGDPLVNLLMRLKLPRTLAATIVFVVIMLAVLALLLFLIPLLVHQVVEFFNRLPAILTWIQQSLLPWLNLHFDLAASFDLQTLKNTLAQHWQQAGNVAAAVWSTLSRSGLAFLAWLIKLLLVPVVTFYLLRDWNKVIDGVAQLLPRRVAPKIISVVKECNSVLGAFLRGQLLVMLSLAIIYSVGLAIIGVDLALLIGVATGVLTIVPYLGVVVGIVASCIAVMMQFHDTMYLVYVGILFLIGHVAENMVLTPWLVGDRIGLHPVAVIFAVMAGGHLFGFMGVLLALPVAAVVMVLLRHLKHHYVKSVLYS